MSLEDEIRRAHELLETSEGYLFARDLGDGRRLVVEPQLFGRARMGIGPSDLPVYDDFWDYPSPLRAIAAAEAWDGIGEPEGWHRHWRSGRYRPEGNAAREYVKQTD